MISISVPVFNELENLDELIARLTETAEKSPNYNFEFVFTDNNSTDGTFSKLAQMAKLDTRIRAIRFSHNIGVQKSILVNYSLTKGDAVIQIDADLQDPPELILEFIKLWEAGFKVVTGIRRSRKEGIVTTKFREVGYWLIDKLSDHPITRNAGDFRMLDREVVNQIIRMKNPNPYIRGSISRLGIAEGIIEYDRFERKRGQSKFGYLQLIKLGITALSNHARLPEKLAKTVSLLAFVGGISGAIYYVLARFFQPNWPRGLASIYVLVLFSISLNSFLIGYLLSLTKRITQVLFEEPEFFISEITENGK